MKTFDTYSSTDYDNKRRAPFFNVVSITQNETSKSREK